ncbi:MAG: Fic family protein [Actinomycetaceae bacterium]|nr:Fic family protein [Actinomycetaceae bacterium]
MTFFDTWESYFYPDTYDATAGVGVLRNLLDERTYETLRAKEYLLTEMRTVEIYQGDADIVRTYDSEHIKSIHAYVFQDVYEWAGQYRSVDMFKGGNGFALVDSKSDMSIDSYMNDVHSFIVDNSWSTLSHEDFAQQSAKVFASLNRAHPFREGNGRASKVFMEHVAELSSFQFEFHRIDADVWNEMSWMSSPDRFSREPHPEYLYDIFTEAARPRQGKIITLEQERSIKRHIERDIIIRRMRKTRKNETTRTDDEHVISRGRSR